LNRIIIGLLNGRERSALAARWAARRGKDLGAGLQKEEGGTKWTEIYDLWRGLSNRGLREKLWAFSKAMVDSLGFVGTS